MWPVEVDSLIYIVNVDNIIQTSTRTKQWLQIFNCPHDREIYCKVDNPQNIDILINIDYL